MKKMKKDEHKLSGWMNEIAAFGLLFTVIMLLYAVFLTVKHFLLG
jgi:hypothetical protein